MDAVQSALAAIEERTRPHDGADRARLAVAAADDAVDLVDRLTAGLRRDGRLTLNFHPDRLGEDRRTVARGLRDSGRYLSQHETGLSNGGRFAVPGGARTQREAALFGSAYERRSTNKPIYGALDVTRDPHGGAPRFGSSWVALSDSCFDRATFCFGDSLVDPGDVGTLRSMSGVLAALFEDAATGSGLDRGLDVDDVRSAIEQGRTTAAPARSLDGYIEAQIHGGISLADDVVAIGLDPSFIDTEIHTDLQAAAATYDFQLICHGGSELSVDDVPPDFRGPKMPALASRVADPDGVVDAAAIGRAVSAVPWTPPSIAGDPEDGDLQQLKKLWHCVLRFGSDAS